MKPENKATDTAVPSVDELTGELNREKYRSRYKKLLRSTIYTLVIVAAISVLVATLLLPVLQIYGTSMNPNLQEEDIVVSVKSPQFKTGDIIAFYYTITTAFLSSALSAVPATTLLSPTAATYM